MKNTILILSALACLSAFADWKPAEQFQKMTANRRVCVGREIVVIGGVTNVITRWERNGKPDWKLPAVETNVVKKLEGKKQYNPLQHDAEELRDFEKLAAKASKKDAKTFEKECKNLEKARDKSSSQEFKDLYQRTLDIWRAKVEEANR